MSKCNEQRQNEVDEKIIDFFETQSLKEGFDKEYGYDQYRGKMGKFWDKIKTLYTNEVSQKDLDKAIKRYVKPGDREQVKLAFDITAMLQNNPILAPHFNDYMTEQLVHRGIKVDWLDTEDKRVPVIDSIPVSALRVFHFDIHRWVNGGKMYKQERGVVGNFQYEWMAPRQSMKLDPSGLMAEVNKVTERFAINAQSYANLFIEAPRTPMGKKKRDFGIRSITQNVTLFGIQNKIPKDTIWRLFSEVMDGRTIIDKKGNILRYQEYVKMPDIGWVWKSPKGVGPEQFAYRNAKGKPTILESLSQIPTYEGWASEFEEFVTLVKQARHMLAMIGNEGVGSIEFVTKENKRLAKIEKAHGLEEYMADKIEDLLDTTMEIGGLNAAELKKDKYYPSMFKMDLIPAMFSRVIEKQEDALADKTDALNDPDANFSPTRRNQLLRAVVDHQASIAGIQGKVDMAMDPEQSFDTTTGIPTKTSVWYKNFKNITNVFADMEMNNQDDTVMLDYVTQFARQDVRNKSVLKVREAVLNAKINGANENQINAAVEMFNTTFYNRNAASQMFGVDMSAEKASRRIGGLVSPEKITQIAKGYSALTTTNLLWGPMQGWVNYSASLLKSDMSGVELWYEATMDMVGPRRDYWKDQVSRAGIDTFAEFVDTYFSKTLRADELKANKGAIKRMKGLIAQAEKTRKTGPLVKYRKYLRSLRSKRRYARLDGAAQWAIRRITVYNEDAGFFKKIFRATKGFGLELFKSINETEEMLRSTSYIMGVKNAIKTGYATREDDPRAIDMGIHFAFVSDFGLSQNNVGAALRGPIAGSTLNKMRIWHNQKAGFDIRLARDAAVSVTPVGRMRNLRIAFNGVKMFTPLFGTAYNLEPLLQLGRRSMGGRPGHARRMENPFAAAGYTGHLRMGMISVLFDMLIGMPGSMGVLHGAMKRMVFQSPSLRGIQGAGSATISTALLAYSVGWALLHGESEEDWDEYVSKWSRKWAGVGGNQLIEIMLEAAVLAGLAKDRDTYGKRHWEKGVAPVIPLGKDVFIPLYKELPKYVDKELIQH